MSPVITTSRRGITLLEVLISIGILAIGLSSVVALIPAGKSEVARAVILDRSAIVAANTLADAVTYGLTRPTSVQLVNVPPPPNPTQLPATCLVFDPVGAANGALYLNAEAAALKTTGVFSGIGPSPGIGSPAVHELFLRSRDDVNYLPPPANDPDGLPRNDITGGTRSFIGRTTCLIALAKINPLPQLPPEPPLQDGDLAKLSVVTFYNRDLTLRVPAAFDPATGLLIPAPGTYGDRSLKQLVRPGTVLYDPANLPHLRWCQVALSAVEPGAANVYVTFTGQQPSGTDVLILVDSTGLAEQLVTLEGTGPYTK